MDISTALGMAFSSGLNAYLPLFSLALASDIWPAQFQINPAFHFISQPWFIVLMGILTVADFFADKIPVVDHVWDAIHTVLRPLAGALVAAAATGGHVSGPWVPVIMVVGAALAGMTHTTKAATRAASTVTTAGIANPFISLLEDVFVVIGVLLSLIVPQIMLVVVIIFVLIFLFCLPRIIRSIQRIRQKRQMRHAQAMSINQQKTVPF